MKKNYIFAVPFGTLLGHIVSKEGLCVELSKLVVIMNMDPLQEAYQQLCLDYYTDGKYIKEGWTIRVVKRM